MGGGSVREGLLWYDDDPGRDLAEKVTRAARRYKQRFGASPTVCYVHPSALSHQGASRGNGKVHKVGGVLVEPLPSVLRNHFWVGREEERRRARSGKSQKS